MTLGSSGLAYVIAVWCVFRLGRPLRLALAWRLALTASFALATVAPTYAAQVNNHILLLAVAAALCVELAWLVEGAAPLVRFAAVGTLAGFGYSIDLGAGPVLVARTAGFVVSRYWKRPEAVLICGLLRPALLPRPSRSELLHRRHIRPRQFGRGVFDLARVAIHRREHDRRLEPLEPYSLRSLFPRFDLRQARVSLPQPFTRADPRSCLRFARTAAPRGMVAFIFDWHMAPLRRDIN